MMASLTPTPHGSKTITNTKINQISTILSSSIPQLEPYDSLYRTFHANPELSGCEVETAARIAIHLRKFSDPAFTIHETIGGHGIIAILENGPGETVLLRADMDALPIKERTNLPYASTVPSVAHACGHDMHITTLLATSSALHASTPNWHGTLLLLFQPAEEDGTGAQSVCADPVYRHVLRTFPPSVLLGAHVVPAPFGLVAVRKGAMTSNSDSLHITIFGRGGHASMPESTIDPVVLAAYIIIRLQSIVSREVAPRQHAVITVGSLQAGQAENVIPSSAILKINIRTFNSEVRKQVLKAVKRVVDAECSASGCEKAAVIKETLSLPMVWNDEGATDMLSTTFEGIFGSRGGFVGDINPLPGSEDFGHLVTGAERPGVFWVYGCMDPALFETSNTGLGEAFVPKMPIPSNHSAEFAPEIEGTLRTAVETYVAAALTWLL